MKIFINYRRDDEANISFAIANALMKEFGVENIFFDRQAIQAGSEFPDEINKALENCRIFIPIIGKKWLKIMNKRLALEEKDYVLDEIESALGKGIFVLPILVDDTPMPSERDLPQKLGKLSLINAVTISSDPKRLPLDVKVLINELNELFSRSSKKNKPKFKKDSGKQIFKNPLRFFGILASFAAIGIFTVIYLRNNDSGQEQIEPEKETNEISAADTNIRRDIAEQNLGETVLKKTEVPPRVKGKITLMENEVADIDGNIYKTVLIGDQVWMAENLKVNHYSNGDPIPNVTDSLQWINLQTGAYCSYNNLISNSNMYGYLYNWYAVSDKRGLCPDGWHVPIYAEYEMLSDYLGDWKIAGGKLKETGYEHWEIPNIGADNTTGFSALPGGCRNKHGFSGIGTNSYFWFNKSAWIIQLDYDSPEKHGALYDHFDGYSVRCIKH